MSTRLRDIAITKITNPIGIYEPIQYLQEKLEGLWWVEKSFGRTFKRDILRDESTYTMPSAYISGNEYIPLDPDDTVRAFSFIEYLDNYEGIGQLSGNSQISIIVFANVEQITRLQTIPNTANPNPWYNLDHIIDEELIQDVLNTIKNSAYFDSDDPPQIFRGLKNAYSEYSYTSFEPKFNRKVYATFKITIDVPVQYNCI